MGGGSSDLHRIPNTRQSRSEWETRERHPGRGRGKGAPPPLRGREATEEQAQRIVAHIVNQPPGQRPPIGQARNPTEDRIDPPGGSGDGGEEEGAAEEEEEGGGGTQGDRAAGPPNKEVRTSGRIAKRHPRSDPRSRKKRKRGMSKKGTGTDRTQGEHQ